MSVDKRENKIIKLYSDSNLLTDYHGRHSYKVFRNLKIENFDLGRTLMNSCSLQNCNFTKCNMDSVDLQGTEFSNCTFIEVSFEGADITSCNFKDCTFERCAVNATNFIDNNFVKCKVVVTSFDEATVNNNIWSNCSFVRFNPNDTSMYSNEFIKCNFTDSKLLTAIYYTIFDNCEFIASEIDSYILGFTFGLRLADLRKLEIEHFNEKNADLKISLRKMHTVYAERRMPLEIKLLDMISSVNIGIEVEKLIKLLFNSLEEGFVIKVDEIRFIRKIINSIYKNNKISLFYYLFIFDELCKKPINQYRNILSDNLFNELTVLYHLIYSIKMDLEHTYIELTELISDNLSFFDDLQIELVYKNRPNFRIYEIINQSGTGNCLPVYESTGSFHEVYAITMQVLESISVVLTILGTSVGGIVLAIKKHIKKKAAKAKKTDTPHITPSIVKTAPSERIVNEYTSENISIIERKVNEVYTEEHKTFIKETIFRQTVHTVIQNKEKIVRDYDKKTFKQVVIEEVSVQNVINNL